MLHVRIRASEGVEARNGHRVTSLYSIGTRRAYSKDFYLTYQTHLKVCFLTFIWTIGTRPICYQPHV
jgi:hypothetical protein